MLNNQTYLILEWFLFAGLFILGGIYHLKYRHRKKNISFIIVCISLLIHLLFNISIITDFIKNFTPIILIDQINGHLFTIALVYHLIEVTKVKLKPVFLFVSTVVGIIVSAYFYYLFLNLNLREQNIFFDKLRVFQPSKLFLIPILFIQISDAMAIVYIITINNRFKIHSKNYLSDNNIKTRQYSNTYTYVLTILFILCVLFILFLPKQFAQFVMIPMVFYFFFFISLVLYSGIPSFELEQNTKMAYKLITENEEIANINENETNITEQINKLILGKELFKNPDFTLFDLAQELSIGSKQLSNYINHNLDTNFAQLVNNFRINEAKKLLLDKQNLTLDAIAELSGFRNRITFYRVFKKSEDISPSEYKTQSTNN